MSMIKVSLLELFPDNLFGGLGKEAVGMIWSRSSNLLNLETIVKVSV